MAVFVDLLRDDLNPVGDRVDDVEHLFARPFRGEGAALVIRQRDAAQAGAAHRLAGGGWRQLRRVGAKFVAGTRRVVRAGDEFGDRMAHVVRFLQELGAVTRAGESPDIVRPGAQQLEGGAVEPGARQLALEEGFFLLSVRKGRAAGAHDRRVVEQALREVKPRARRAFELMGKQVRILNPDSG